jgi:hypothetical protein
MTDSQFVVEQTYEFLRVTGEITTNWFFFAGAVNAAVIGWLLQSGLQPKLAKFTSTLFVACDSMLAAKYLIVLPIYYYQANATINDLKTSTNIFPFWYWILASVVLGLICWAMAGAWWFFFWTDRGKERINQLIGNPPPPGSPM